MVFMKGISRLFQANAFLRFFYHLRIPKIKKKWFIKMIKHK